MHRRLVVTVVILMAFVCTGCMTYSPHRSAVRARTQALRADLLTLGTDVSSAEADRLAVIAVESSIDLAAEYRVVRPPWLHNNLVNHGFRERGLCFEWTNDLFARLHQTNWQTLQVRLAVARMDTRREHNALVVTARGQPFSDGMVLDAWRGSGRIWWGPVSTDKYPWQPLPSDRINPALLQFVNK